MEHLPAKVKASLHGALVSKSASPASISRLLSDAITEIDNTITHDFLRLFPMRPDDLGRLRDKDIAAHLKGQGVGPASPNILRCMQGSTALLTLVGPSMGHLWVANLGDCRAGELPFYTSAKKILPLAEPWNCCTHLDLRV